MFSLFSKSFGILGLILFTFIVHSGRECVFVDIACGFLLCSSILIDIVHEVDTMKNIDKLEKKIQELLRDNENRSL